MSELRIDRYTMPAANLGPASPMVPLWYDTAELAVPRKPVGLGEEDVKYFGYGYHHGCLPYFVQDNYDRARTPRPFKAAVLENENLRATFLLELGGRLWSLFDKRTNRELLHVNPVFQPANLGLRNAWISGGVEWNFCWMGHTPFTVDPIFAARTQLDDGTPVLRMWEYERVRKMSYQIDAWLPDGSPVLLVRVRLANQDDRTVPVYWWSNMAVPERKDTRVIVPAVASHQWAPGVLERHTYPVHEGRDYSYPTNAPNSGDRFYRIEPGQYPWIASVDGQGKGFFQSSTARLIGRKLWVFGQNAGGRMWQDFLNTPGHPYIEIQAGVARTQGECLPLPPKDRVGMAGGVWGRRYQRQGRPGTGLDSRLAGRPSGRSTRASPSRRSSNCWRPAAAWRKSRRRRSSSAGLGGAHWRTAFGPRPAGSRSPRLPCPSPKTPWDRNRPRGWPCLIRGRLPETAPNQPPVSWMIQDEWREMLEKSVGIRPSRPSGASTPANSAGVAPSDHWLAWLHLGVMYIGGQWNFDKARQAWERSIACKPSAWAYRMLAALANHLKNPAEAARLYPKAVELAPDNQRLVVECGKTLVQAGQARQWLKIVDSLPASVRGHSHVKLYEAIAATEVDDLDRAGRVLNEKFELVEVREGETVSVQAWFTYQEKRIAKAEGIAIDEALKERVRKECPPPKHLDFRL